MSPSCLELIQTKSAIISAQHSVRSTIDRRAFVLDYRLDMNNNVLHIGDNRVSLVRPTQPETPEPISVVVRIGDQDGINPPWFTFADSTLLFWWIHRETATLQLEIQWAEEDESVVKVLLVGASKVVSPGVKTSFSCTCADDCQQYNSHAVNVAASTLLLTLKHTNPETSAQSFSASIPADIPSSSPSRTCYIRVAIITIIGPIGLLVYTIFCALGPAANGLLAITWFFAELVFFYGCFLVLCWVAKGRPPVDEFLATQPIMRVIKRHVGVAMPDADRSNVEGDEGQMESRIAIRSVSDFFRSSAPLDDLLASFDSTRGLTQPMTFTRTTTVPGAGTDSAEASGVETLSKSESKPATTDTVVDLEAGLGDPEKKLLV